MADEEKEWEPAPQTDVGPKEQGVPEPFYGSVNAFVEQFLSVATEVRTGGTIAWCPKWWAHPQAVLRITALWRAWETLRLEPGTGMSTWWTLHYDPHTRLLTDAERGPFAYCNRGHVDGKPGPLPLEPPVENWQTRPVR